MANAARDAGVVARRIHLAVAIDRLLARLLVAAPGQWVVKGGYANQLRRPDNARFTEDLDLKIDAAIETAPELLASGFAVDLTDDFSYEVASSPAPLEGPPGGGLRFVVAARLSGTELVRFKVDISAADAVVGELESYFSDPVLERLGFRRSRFPVYPVNQHLAEKLHALTLPRDVENTRQRRSHPEERIDDESGSQVCLAAERSPRLRPDLPPGRRATSVRSMLRPASRPLARTAEIASRVH